jgi:histone-lysine N-methyltransferase SETMAR
VVASFLSVPYFSGIAVALRLPVSLVCPPYNNLLHNDMHQGIWKKTPGKLSKKIILLHGNAHPHMENLMKATLTMGWEIIKHPPYSPYLQPSDFQLYVPMKVHLGCIFQADDEFKRGVLKWLDSQDENFYAAGITNLPRWKNYVSVKGEHLEKEQLKILACTFFSQKTKSRSTLNNLHILLA